MRYSHTFFIYQTIKYIMGGALMELITEGHREMEIYQQISTNGSSDLGKHKVNSVFEDQPIEKFGRSCNDLSENQGSLYDDRKEFTIDRELDLMADCYLRFQLGSDDKVNTDTILNMIEDVRYEVGATHVLDSFNGDCMRARFLHDTDAKPIISKEGDIVVLPLRLSTSLRRNTYLPLICLAFDQVKIIVKLKDPTYYNKMTLLVEYIGLDTMERRSMCENLHTYRIFPRMYQDDNSSGKKKFDIGLLLDQTIRDIIIVSKRPLTKIRLTINGHNRYKIDDAFIFQKFYARKYGIQDNDDYIYFMPFDNTITEPIVNGSLNTGRIDHLVLSLKTQCTTNFRVTTMVTSVTNITTSSGMLGYGI